MKTRVGAVLGLSLLLFAGFASAQDDAVYSANAVGVIRYTIPANGELTAIALPLNPMSGSAVAWSWTNTPIADALPRSSYIYCWRDSKWAPSLKQRTGWSQNFEIQPGEAFFVQSSATTNIVVSLLGEVPVDDTLPIPLAGDGNLNMTSVTMYPVEMALTNSAFADLPRSTYLFRWNGTSWDTNLKQRNGWSDTSWILDVGEGVFVQLSGSSTNVVETRPFEW